MCVVKIKALQTVLIEKRNELIDNAVSYAKQMCEDLDVSTEPRSRTMRKQKFEYGSGGAALSYEDELRRKLFSSLDRITMEIQERFQQLQNLAVTFACITPAVLLDSDDPTCNLDHADQVDEKDFKIERVRLRTYVVAANKENELIKAGPLELLKFIVKSKLEDTLPNIVIMLRIFLTIAISNASCERSFSKLKLIKNYLRSTMCMLRLTNLAILAIEQEVSDAIDIESAIKEFSLRKSRKVKL